MTFSYMGVDILGPFPN